MAEVLHHYATCILVEVLLDGGTLRFANRDFYDNSDRYHKGTLLDFPAISEELSDLYYGVEQSSTVTLRFANRDNGVDDSWDTIVAGEELREKSVRIRRAEDDPVDLGLLTAENDDFLTTEDGSSFSIYEFEEALKFEFRGKIIDYKIGDEVEITVESRDDWVLDTLLPLHVVTTDLFTATALDLGEPVNICFGKCRNVPLRNIQNDTGTDQYDYLIGYGTLQSLWVDHANGIGVHRRDSQGWRLVDTSEYTFYDGSQATYSGYAFVRFTTEQRDFSGGMCQLAADVYGLEMGTTAMQRNFADVIGNLFSNTSWGLSADINAASFAAAAAALDTIGNMYCDGAVTKQQQARDIINELLFPARASIERNADGEWIIDIDVAGASALSLGDNDGYYNNAEIGSLSITPSNNALKTAIVQYSLNPLSENMPFKEESISVHTFGVERTYSLPFVLEDDTATRVLSYLKNRSLYSDRRVTVFAGMEGRDLSRGDIVTLTKDTRLLSADDFKIEKIVRGGIGFELECREYNGSIYDNEAVVAPTGPTASEITVEGPRSLVGASQLGDGINHSGTITLELAPDQGDCYIKGGSVNEAAWTADPGFILGIDDTDDLAKFFIGDADSWYKWDGSDLTIKLTTTDALSQVDVGDEAKITFNYTNTATVNQASTFKTLLSAQPAGNSDANYYSSVLLSEFTTDVNLNVDSWLFGAFSHARLKGTGTIANAVGFWGRADVYAAGTVTDAYGTVGQARLSAAGGAITTGYGLLGAVRNNSTGTIATGAGVAAHVINTSTGIIDTAYGVLILTPTNNGTINNLYGLYQEGSEPNYLRGNLVVDGRVGIGTSISLTARLNILENVDGHAAQFRNAGDNVNREGLRIACGENDQSASVNYHIRCTDGVWGNVGGLRHNAGTMEIYQISARVLKQDIADTTINGRETIMGLQVRDFKWVANPDEVHTGFVAEEVSVVWPRAVAVDPETGMLTLAKTALIEPMVKHAQEMQTEIDELTQKNQEFTQKNQELTQRIELLEAAQ